MRLFLFHHDMFFHILLGFVCLAKFFVLIFSYSLLLLFSPLSKFIFRSRTIQPILLLFPCYFFDDNHFVHILLIFLCFSVSKSEFITKLMTSKMNSTFITFHRNSCNFCEFHIFLCQIMTTLYR